MKQETMVQLSSLLRKLHDERNHHLESIDEIDAIFARFGVDPESGGKKRGPGRPRGSTNKKKKKTKKKAASSKKKATKKKTKKKTGKRGSRGLKAGGQRVQGVKQALQDALTSTAQSPADLQAKVSKKVGQEVSIATQLHMLKRDGVAKAVGRGQWVKA
jgi:hypothetical protein